MKLIIDFYKGLDTLNLIIFWGIIIVIILLLIFSIIMINKNKKLKKLVATKILNNEEELPIKKEIEKEEIILEKNKEVEEIPIIEEQEEIKTQTEEKMQPLEIENNFIVEEHIIKYNQEENIKSNNIKTEENNEKNRVINIKSPIEIPNKPYQKNVLREMSLSQTSPIGINRQMPYEDKNITMARDLEKSLNNNELEISSREEEIKKELKNMENTTPRKTEIKIENEFNKEMIKQDDTIEKEEKMHNIPNYKKDELREEKMKKTETSKDYLKNGLNEIKKVVEKNNSKEYLEEVSRKLAAAEIPDEIERTNYELQQEEDAIISYKELMEKKDSIQTIDEEDAVISIGELLERSNQKQEENSKLYKLTEEEENDNFINELKQFRNDL